MVRAACALLLLASSAWAGQDEPWVLENARLRVAVQPVDGAITVFDKTAGQEWSQGCLKPPSAAGPRFRGMKRAAGAISFEADFGESVSLTVSLRLTEGESELAVEADMADREAEFPILYFLEPFVLDAPQGVLVVADYSNGHLYPLEADSLPCWWFDADRLDMPWIGACDLDTGRGYMILFERCDDAAVRCEVVAVGGRRLAAPQVVLRPCRGRLAYPRRFSYRFFHEGGYVAMAKAYRARAKEQGLLVTLTEKIRKNPNVARLLGAPDVWGWKETNLEFAREARAAGVEKMLIHGRRPPEQLREINAIGYLTSEYDNYNDILPLKPGKGVDRNHDLLPDHAVLQADGQRKKAWLTMEGVQYMKRCPARWLPAAQAVIPKILATHPFLGRFIDVVTAEHHYECYDERHPLTRADHRMRGAEFMSYVRSLGVVVGGEHGIWWSVPHLDYIEGMMSGGYYSWPAGHLVHPKSKEEEHAEPGGKKLGKWESYERWGLGHEWRVPLWELVFHDCVVSTWYWGDATDWLLEAAPEATSKKDAFNVLYGTPPLLWASSDGSWQRARDVFLRSVRNTCALHEVVGLSEMVSHEFVTPDRAVQATRFSDGTRVVVNFGPRPHEAVLEGRKWILPQNGFAAKGPQIEQSLALVEGRAVTTIRRHGYLFSDAQGVELTLRSVDPDRLWIRVGPGRPVTFRPGDVVEGWDLAGTRAYRLDASGKRLGEVQCRPTGPEALSVGPFDAPTALEAVFRSASDK